MRRRLILLGGMLAGWFTAQGAVNTFITPGPPIAMPEPASVAELGVSLSALLGYCWWRVSRRKQKDS